MRRPRSFLLLLMAMVLGATACPEGVQGNLPPEVTPTGPSVPIDLTGKPNFLILLSDDQAYTTFTRAYMPHTFADLVDQGVFFSRAYANVSLCCPSRASILTGLYAHHSGVGRNDDPLTRPELARPTFVQALHGAGYRTMLDGKYLNSEPCTPRVGWDRWICGAGQHIGGFPQQNPHLEIDGKVVTRKGYTTDILAAEAISFIRESEAAGKPWLVYYSPKTPHLPATDTRYASMAVPPNTSPSYNRVAEGAPTWAQIPPFDAATEADIRDKQVRMTQQLPPLDNAMHTILASLGDQADNTFVIYLTDNGFQFGEHRLLGKQAPYEESVRLPMVVRFPTLVPPAEHFVNPAPVSNVDVPATIMDLAGISWYADGISMVPLLTRRANSIRTGSLLEWCEVVQPGCSFHQPGHLPAFFGIDTGQEVYVRYGDGDEEVYDLRTDPFELHNIALEPQAQATKLRLSSALATLRAEPATPETTIASGPDTAPGTDQISFVFFSPALTTTFECSLHGPGRAEAWTPCPGGTAGYPGLSSGSYTFAVRARDAAGHLDPTPAELEFRVVSR